jgi:hypothetical protein
LINGEVVSSGERWEMLKARTNATRIRYEKHAGHQNGRLFFLAAKA